MPYLGNLVIPASLIEPRRRMGYVSAAVFLPLRGLLLSHDRRHDLLDELCRRLELFPDVEAFRFSDLPRIFVPKRRKGLFE